MVCSLVVVNWVVFVCVVVECGYCLIVQNLDGELVGGFVWDVLGVYIMVCDWFGLIDVLQQFDGQWKINQVLCDWQVMLDWFVWLDNVLIFQVVVGWELINELMVYGNGLELGKIYSWYIVDLIGVLDWCGKWILVGGLGVLVQFVDLDYDLICQVVGFVLIWLVYLYLIWVVLGYFDLFGIVFCDQLCKCIGSLCELGDDILIIEIQFYMQIGLFWFVSDEKCVVLSFNMVWELLWLVEQGIGLIWWLLIGCKSELLIWNGQCSGYSVVLDLVVFVYWGWL